MSKEYCSILTQKLQVDGCGTAPPNIKYFLFIETEQPWPENEKGLDNYPQYAFDLAQGNLKIHLLAPGAYSKDGFKKIIFFELSKDNIAHFDRREYQVPNEVVEELIHSLFSANTSDSINKFDQYKSEPDVIRDLFICGHAAKDYCCGTFGDALYQFASDYLQENKDKFPNVKIWQSSHLKGHKFAPTMVDFPEGRYWGHLNQDLLINKILPLAELETIDDLRMHIRGLVGTNNFGQIAEREFLSKYGPSWIQKKKTITVLPDPDNKNVAKVTIGFEQNSQPDSKTVTVTLSEQPITVTDHACGAPSSFKKGTVTF